MKKILSYTAVLLLILALALLGRVIYKQIQNEKALQIRVEMVTHLIENIELYEDELKELGYSYEILYTTGDAYNWNYTKGSWDIENIPSYIADDDLTKKCGYEERGMIRLEVNNYSYLFDVGLEAINVQLDNDMYLFMGKNGTDDRIISLTDGGYPMSVSINSKYDDYRAHNDYNMDFSKILITYDDEQLDDIKIKDYVSMAELQSILNKGLELETQLVEIYEQKPVE